MLVAVLIIAVRIMSGVQSGCASLIRATDPAVCGVAMLVPLMVAYIGPEFAIAHTKLAVGAAARMFTPGAEMSGLICPKPCTGPLELKSATWPTKMSENIGFIRTGRFEIAPLVFATLAARTLKSSGEMVAAGIKVFTPFTAPRASAMIMATAPAFLACAAMSKNVTPVVMSLTNAMRPDTVLGQATVGLSTKTYRWASDPAGNPALPDIAKSRKRFVPGAVAKFFAGVMAPVVVVLTAEATRRSVDQSPPDPGSVFAAGEITRRPAPGAPTVPSPGPELPAAATTLVPNKVALSDATALGESGPPPPPKLMLMTFAIGFGCRSTVCGDTASSIAMMMF